MLDAVIFDMDGLLIDSEPFWHRAEQTVFASLGLTLTTAMCRQTTGIRIDEVVGHYYRLHAWTGPSQAEVAAAIIAEVTRLIASQGQAMVGVHETLQLFREQNVRIALASSSPHGMIDTALAKLEIGHYFDVLSSAADEPYGKPHPAVYLSTAVKLGVSPAHCLAFEDSFPGLIAAKAAGMKVVAVPDPHQFGQARFNAADLTLPSLRDFVLEDFLDAQTIN
ncbi:MAG: hexitol phosphatase HxpB [Pseudomonadales bacterium]|nr:hexitol phosphatase HxpB [Pseudomonadales bacterium]